MKCKNGIMKLELPAQVEVNGVTGMMHRAHVNYFSNNIGIASITFHPARITAEAAAAEAQAASGEEAQATSDGQTRAGFLDLDSSEATILENEYQCPSQRCLFARRMKGPYAPILNNVPTSISQRP